MAQKRTNPNFMNGVPEMVVLRLLSKREMYGYELAQALTQRTDGILEMGQSTLYPMLYNLQAKGLIASRWETLDSGRRRKYYRLTNKGKRRLADDTAQWSAVTRAMAKLGIVPDGSAAMAAGGVPA